MKERKIYINIRASILLPQDSPQYNGIAPRDRSLTQWFTASVGKEEKKLRLQARVSTGD